MGHLKEFAFNFSNQIGGKVDCGLVSGNKPLTRIVLGNRVKGKTVSARYKIRL